MSFHPAGRVDATAMAMYCHATEGDPFMNHGQRKTRSAVVVDVDPAAARRAVSNEVEESPLFGVAMLKIALELKKPGAGALDEILSGVLSRMRIDERDFRLFLSQNGGLLRAIAPKKSC
jgi:hypothetical protein